jgi:prevent-host-death family protein
MDYVTVRELREKSGEIWQRVEDGEEFVVTRNGKPIALLVHTAPTEVEARLRALRLGRLGSLVAAIQADAQASGTNTLTEDEIQAEIDAARRERRGGQAPAPAMAAEPPAKPYARRR